jgi:hypothetical protein
MSVANCFEYGLTLLQPTIGFNSQFQNAVGEVITITNGFTGNIVEITGLSKGVYIVDGFIKITAVDDDAVGTTINIDYSNVNLGGGVLNTALWSLTILDGSAYWLPIKYTFYQDADTNLYINLDANYTSTGSLETDEWAVNVWKIA